MQKVARIIAAVMIATFLISACGESNVSRSRATEEAAVYSALINHQLAYPYGIVLEDSILIINKTYDKSYYEIIRDNFLFENLAALDNETIDDFRTVNQDGDVMDVSLSIDKPYEYVSLEQLKNYPNDVSVLGFSKVGFNPGWDQALAYMLYDCGTECGAASIYFLLRKENGWEIEKEILFWE